jgi:hypothetical protein
VRPRSLTLVFLEQSGDLDYSRVDAGGSRLRARVVAAHGGR